MMLICYDVASTSMRRCINAILQRHMENVFKSAIISLKKCVWISNVIMTSLVACWRAPNTLYCIIVICCYFYTVEYNYLIFIYHGKNISTFKTIYDFHVFIF